MKILILSDTHDNIVRLKHVLGFAVAGKMDAVIVCGDWGGVLSVEAFHEAGVKIPVYGVLGNADIDPQMPQMLKKICTDFDPDFLKKELDGKIVGIAHFPTRLEQETEKGKLDIGFCGHTHMQREWLHNGVKLVNPGAISRTLSPSFAVYDTKTNDVEFVDVAL